MSFIPFKTDLRERQICPANVSHILEMLANNDQEKRLQLELAAVVDVAEPFVKATYILEGDGELVFTCYSALQQLATHASEVRYTNLAAKAAEVAGGNNQKA